MVDINSLEYLSQTLGLSPYQENHLRLNQHKYNMGRLVKRGGVLYAPHAGRGFIRGIGRVLFGCPADLIGKNKTLLKNQRGIKFCADGYHCVRIGRFTYYADPNGQAVSREIFMRASQR